jgi:hypothetical protein
LNIGQQNNGNGVQLKEKIRPRKNEKTKTISGKIYPYSFKGKHFWDWMALG